MGIASGVVVAIVIATVVIASSGGGSPMATRVPMVDVRTGKVFWISVASRAVMVPAAHPESGERTLVGAERMPDGMWRILPHDLELVAAIGGAVSPRIDRGTGAVRSESEVDQ